MSTRSGGITPELTPQVHLERIKGWDKLISQDQQIIRKETQALLGSVLEAGKQRLKVGEHLTKVRDVLEPKRMFMHYLQTLNISRATAYRFMDTYLGAKTILPSPVLQVALMRGTDSINPRLVKAFPPPKSTDVAVISAYLDKISKREKGETPVEDEDQAIIAETKKREVINFIRSRWTTLPQSMTKRERTAWMNDIRGMTLSLQGIANPLTIEAQAIPSDYQRKRGRPPLKKETTD